MNDRQRGSEMIVDDFVMAVNACPREPLPYEGIPAVCRRSRLTDAGCYDWQIVPSEAPPWLVEFAAKLPYPWPLSFQALIGRYQFPSFACDPLEFYSVGLGNPSEKDGELRVAILRDHFMTSILWKSGFLPFARPVDSSYDPVCFDCRRMACGSEPAVVRIDHEEILCRERIRVMEVVSPSFQILLEQMTNRLRAEVRPRP